MEKFCHSENIAYQETIHTKKQVDVNPSTGSRETARDVLLGKPVREPVFRNRSKPIVVAPEVAPRTG